MTISTPITQFISHKDWEGLYNCFNRMTNSDFRRSEKIIREQILPKLDNENFWDTYMHLNMYRPQSFISGILAISNLIKQNKLSLDCKEAQETAQWFNEKHSDSNIKILKMAIPLLTSHEQIEDFFSLFKTNSPQSLISILLNESSDHAYFTLFKHLKYISDNHDIVRQTCIVLIKKNTDKSYNMASILQCYFDIKDIKSTFSLDIQPYELNYIDKSYDNFVKFLNGKKPCL